MPVPQDTTDLVKAAVEAAEAGNEVPLDDTPEGDDEGEAEEAADGGEAAAEDEADADGKEAEDGAEAEPPEKKEKVPDAPDEDEAEVAKLPEEDRKLVARLKELGLKDLKLVGGSGNRIPHRETRRILRNALKKVVAAVDAAHGKTLQDRDTETGQFKKRAEAADNWDRMAKDDPERTVRTLALLFPSVPAYQRAVRALDAKEEAATETTSKSAALPDGKDDPKPEPDQKYQDGSFGYSHEGWAKYQEWLVRDARRTAIAEMETKYGPKFKVLDNIETERKGAEKLQADVDRIRAEVADAREEWGDLFEKNEKAIVDAMAAHEKATGKRLSVGRAAARVLKPLLEKQAQTNQQEMRDKILKELNGRPRVAKKTPAPNGAAHVSGKNKSTIDIVAEAVAAAEAAGVS